MEKIKGGLSILVFYFIGAFVSEFIFEKLADWIFDTTPAQSPFIFCTITSFWVFCLLGSLMEGETPANRKIIGIGAILGWGFMLWGDLSDIFAPPEKPNTFDLLLMYLFPTTLDGTLFDGFNVIGSLIATLKKSS